MVQKYVLKGAPAPPLDLKVGYKNALNESQFAVVTQADGACLVLAGAGSGKTRTLIYRVAYLLEKGVRPEEILLVTFTNKAAQEMRGRVESLLQTKAKGLWCGTFHHIGHRILRRWAREAGLKEHFGILDEEDSRDLIKTCIKALPKGPSDARLPKPGVVQSILSFSVNAGKTIAEVVAKNYPYFAGFIGEFEKIKQGYEERKKRTGHLDYDDLLFQWMGLLKSSESVRRTLTEQFRYCLVDEYQDTNRLQHELMGILSCRHRNILVVGDDAQSIYSFRAAEVRNILDFPEKYEHSKIFKLETNYRSTKAILELANESIRHNIHQFPKTLHNVRPGGARPQLARVRDMRQQADFIAQRISEMNEAGVGLSEIAVLFRAHYQAAELELELARRGIPYLVRGGIRFFEQAHVKDALAYLRIAANPLDELAWTRALTLQPGIGATYAEKIFESAGKEKGGFEKVFSHDFGAYFSPKIREGLGVFKRTMKALLKEEVNGHPDLMLEAVLENGYNKQVLVSFDNAQERLEDLRQLVNFAHTYKNLRDFLADVTLREGFRGESLLETRLLEKDVEELVLSTIHQAKGLEWHAVFVISVSEGQFPHAKSMEDEDQLEEERRLFYVAATRAKEELILVHPMTRYDYSVGTVINRPSLFVEELSKRVLEEVEVEESEEEETIYLD